MAPYVPSRQEVWDLIEKVRYDENPDIDAEVLSTALVLLYTGALTEEEIIGLQVGDILTVTGMVGRKIRKLNAQITPLAREHLYPHLTRLRKIYNSDDNAPLFPDKTGGQYTPQSLNHHLKHYATLTGKNITFESLREAGRRDF